MRIYDLFEAKFDLSQVEVRKSGFGDSQAYYKGRRVGAAAVWGGGTGTPEDAMEMMNVGVSRPYKGKGIGYLLYKAADEYAQSKGKRLIPATSLSNDAFEFWKKFRPEAVKDDGRHFLHHYEGKTVRHKSMRDGNEYEWTIYHAGKAGKFFMGRTFVDGREVTTAIPGQVVFDQLGDHRNA